MSAPLPPGHTETLFFQLLEPHDIEHRETLTGLVARLAGVGRPGDLLTILAEVFANALRHGGVTRMGVTGRRRGPLLLLTFDYDPALNDAACAALARAKSGWLPNFAELTPGGLGLPLLCRLTRRQILSPDRASLQIWLAAQPTEVSPC